MNKKTISVRVHIPLEEIENLLYSARQGTAYWVNEEPEPTIHTDFEISGLSFLDYEKDVEEFMKGNLEIYVFDGEEDDKKHILNIAKIKKGLTAMAKNEPDHFTDLITGKGDMNTADALIQCALFSKTIYS